MKHLLLTSLLFAMSYSLVLKVFAAEQQMDRLEYLSKTLSSGSYSHADDLDNTSRSKEKDFISSLYDWDLVCTKDRFEGTKQCHLAKKDLMIFLMSGKTSVYIGGNHYPRSASAIKVDNNKAVYGYEGVSQNPLNVIEQLKKGKVAYTRYQRWPYEYNRDGEVDLTDFNQKYNEMLRLYKEL